MDKHPRSNIRILPLLLKDIFPLCDLSPPEAEKDDDTIVNEAYEQLFEQLIPGFNEGDVHFVLAEVLELDREKSRPRILVYSNEDKQGFDDLLKKYFEVIASLRDDEWSISKSDAFYTGSRIWCAQMTSAGCEVSDNERSWISEPMAEMSRGYEFYEDADEEKELEEINIAFKKYIRALYDLHLKNFPYAYVMLIPIFLGSMYGKRKKKSRKKLGAIFLHFATSKRIKNKQVLLKIYSRTLLFWHYYYTSEALDKRQDMFEQSRRANDALERSQALFTKVKPYIRDIGKMLREVEKPLFKLEAELNNPEVVIFGGDLSRYFQAGHPITVLGRYEVMPRHGWKDEVGIEAYKNLIAGLLIERFRLNEELEDSGEDLWSQVSWVIESRAGEPSNRLFGELARSIPGLCVREPSVNQVKETFKIIKSWFSDARKAEGGTGLPVSMLEYAFRVWGCECRKSEVAAKNFWVASERPVTAISALGILHEERIFKEANLAVTKRRNGTGKIVTCCELRIGLGGVARKGGRLERLHSSLEKSVKSGDVPGGNMTRFLWDLCGGRQLTLHGTVFSWKEGDQEVAVDFLDRRGQATEMLIKWKGAISV